MAHPFPTQHTVLCMSATSLIALTTKAPFFDLLENLCTLHFSVILHRPRRFGNTALGADILLL